MRSARRSLGFSIIELLVCSCVVVVLATLLCPMILAAQVSSNELRCKNNLKQIGLALHNYHDTFRLFPPGWVTKNRMSIEASGIGWQTMLLPFLDQAPLYNQVDFNNSFNSSESKSKAPFRTVLKSYRCPSDTTPKDNPIRDNWPTSNYSGNGGHRPFPRWSSVPGKSFWPGIVGDDPQRPWHTSSSGLFGPNSAYGIHDIIDGTSNTILVGERSSKSGAGIWPGVTSNAQENDVMTDGSHASRPQQSIRAFSSQHKNLLFLMGDGAVRPIKSDIDSQPNTDPTMPLGLYQRLISRNDGQPLTDF